jgi:uncharacterized protein (TIGR04255 family)
MAKPTQLKNPPIREALVDIRAVGVEKLAARLEEARALLGDAYPNSIEQRRFEGMFQVSGGTLAPPVAQVGFNGYRFTSADGLDIAQFRIDGFTYNRLSPYPDGGGEAVVREALRLWEIYVKVAAPVLVSRVAMRYINAVPLPAAKAPEIYLEQWLRPPAGSPPVLAEFLWRTRTADPETKEQLVTAVALESSTDLATRTLLIDIDAFSVRDYSPDPEDLRQALAGLRTLKNVAFFGIIGDELVRLCS